MEPVVSDYNKQLIHNPIKWRLLYYISDFMFALRTIASFLSQMQPFLFSSAVNAEMVIFDSLKLP